MAQDLVRIAGVVFAGGIGRVGVNGLGETLQRGAVIAGRLRDQAEQIEGRHMRGLARENLATDRLRVADATGRAQPVGLGRKISDAEIGRGRPRDRLPGRFLLSLFGGATFSSIHILQPVQRGERSRTKHRLENKAMRSFGRMTMDRATATHPLDCAY